MKLSEHKDLKKEILNLPPVEKDKLLLRLVAKDKVLTEHLHFLLLENEADLQDRITAIKTKITEITTELYLTKYFTKRDVLIVLRYQAKQINHFLRVTKSIFDDVDLRIFMLNTIPITAALKTVNSYKDYHELFNVYVVKTTLQTLKKFYKLHPDLQFDLKENFETLLAKIYNSDMAELALALNLPKEI
jgi:hypothetical protein